MFQDSNGRKENTIGRLWRLGADSFDGFVELGILGKVRIRMIVNRRKTRPNDSDYLLLAESRDLPLGALREIRDKLEVALYEEEDVKLKSPEEVQRLFTGVPLNSQEVENGEGEE